ncbi:GAF domain-containing protein [Nocardia macrotermitis]|uniref:Rv3651-like N-terminal domain-containing protein n=1 Tax=Nocardia macrotermitis TaxID=2585198 RepID=A0A7K0DHT1_9NOCA|nr:GAF domain-containing protein [Nocardia macrotermitis]MQY24354.1 hypothetical protein [Nocardia macrotermitis]
MHKNHVSSSRCTSHLTRYIDTPPGTPLWNWVIVETLSGPDQATTVLDGSNTRSFTRLRNSTVGKYGAAARYLPSVITRCVNTGGTWDKCFTMPDGRIVRLVGVPILDRSGHTSAVAVWTGARTDIVPALPAVGTVEWNAMGIMTTTPAAQRLLRLPHDDVPSAHTVPEVFASLDHWNDRAGFFELFDLEKPSDRWTGTATRTSDDGVEHLLFFAARASGTKANRAARAQSSAISPAPRLPPTPTCAQLSCGTYRLLPVMPSVWSTCGADSCTNGSPRRTARSLDGDTTAPCFRRTRG